MSLNAFLHPHSIAVVGASPKPGSVGSRIIDQLQLGFSGRIYPVNPNYEEVRGLKSYSSISAVDGPVDLVLIAAAGKLVPSIVREAAEAGVKAAAIFSSGFAEMGGEGDALNHEIKEIIAATGIRVLGPNCLGYANFRNGLRATFTTIPFESKPGNIAVVAQSGAMGIGAASLLRDDGAGVSFWGAAGNELDVSVGELVGALLDDEEAAPDVVAVIMESATNADSLLAAGSKAAAMNKQVIVLKVGRTESGAAAAISHTAAVAGSHSLFLAACEQNGIITVNTTRELVDTARVFADGRRPSGNRLLVVSGSGGTGVLMADEAEESGLEMPQPSAELQARLKELIPAFGSVANPVDITGNIVNDHSSTETLLELVSTSGEYDMIAYSGLARTLPTSYRDTVLKGKSFSDLPYLVVAHQPDQLQLMADQGLTCLADASAIVQACGKLVKAEQLRANLAGPTFRASGGENVPPQLSESSGALSEARAKEVLNIYGVPTPREAVVESVDAAVAAAEAVHGPVVMKINADWLAHKSDVGGIRLGVSGDEQVRSTFDQLAELAHSLKPYDGAEFQILVAEQIPAGIELMVGMTRDPIFGPAITVAAGGVLTEIIAESATSIVPFNRRRAEDMVRSLWNGRLAEHPRGIASAAMPAIVDLIMGVQNLAAREQVVSEVDINPVIVTADRVVAVDALINTSEAKVKA